MVRSVGSSYVRSCVFLCTQQTAYEMRISDWSSAGCSSDLIVLGADLPRVVAFDVAARLDPGAAQRGETGHDVDARGRIGIGAGGVVDAQRRLAAAGFEIDLARSEEHTSELQSLMRISYAVFCLKKKNNTNTLLDKTQDNE